VLIHHIQDVAERRSCRSGRTDCAAKHATECGTEERRSLLAPRGFVKGARGGPKRDLAETPGDSAEDRPRQTGCSGGGRGGKGIRLLATDSLTEQLPSSRGDGKGKGTGAWNRGRRKRRDDSGG
jgi:hypothetical protein